MTGALESEDKVWVAGDHHCSEKEMQLWSMD